MISINFTDEYAYVVSGDKRAGGVQIAEAFAVALPPGAVRDGMLTNAEAVRQALEQEFAARGIRPRDALVTVMTTRISSNEMVFPYARNEKQLDTMLTARLSAALSEGENITDYIVSDKFTEGGIEKCKLDVIVAPRKLVSDYDKLLSQIGFSRRRFDTVKSGLRALYRQYGEQMRDTALAVVENSIIMLVLALPDGGLLARKYSVGAGADLTVEVASQALKLIQFNQITYPGSAVARIALLGSAASAAMAADVAESVGAEAGLFNAPFALTLPQGVEAEVFMMAALAVYGS